MLVPRIDGEYPNQAFCVISSFFHTSAMPFHSSHYKYNLDLTYFTEDDLTCLKINVFSESCSQSCDMVRSILAGFEHRKLILILLRRFYLIYEQIVDLETSFSTANLVRVLNMSFVSLGHVDTLLHSKSSTQKLNILEDKDMVVPALGFGIIRSIDAQRQIFYIITDLPIEVLKDVNCITYGSKIRLPDGIIARQSQEKNSLPYVTASETQSLLETPWQRSFKPKNDK